MRLLRGRWIRFRISGSFALVFLLFIAVGRLYDALTMFGIVLAHELAHVWAAHRYGLTVSEIRLTPIGGVARIDALIEVDPAIECGIALAGPVSNLLMACGAWALWYFASVHGPWVHFFIYVNLSLGAFNLLPALPLDGGRIYRAILSRNVGYRLATVRAAALSKMVAVALFVIGAIGLAVRGLSVTLVLLAIFIYYTARREEQNAVYVLIRYLSGKREELKGAGWLHAVELVAAPDTRLREIVDNFVPKRYHLVWVVDGHGKVLGMVTETQILDAFFDRGMNVRIRDLL